MRVDPEMVVAFMVLAPAILPYRVVPEIAEALTVFE
jgi:hypothetical protein